MLSGWGTIGGAAAVAYAARVGANTFDSWKRQKTEEKRMDAAERILTLAYKLRYNFQSVRSRGIPRRELDAAEKILRDERGDWFDGLEKQTQDRYRTAQAYLIALNRHSDEWNQIWELKPLALAYFGQNVEKNLHVFWSQYTGMSVAADIYAEDAGDDKEFTIANRRDLWGTEDDNVHMKAINGAIEALENELLPVIRSQAGKRPRASLLARGN
jgi:hypothetical protein